MLDTSTPGGERAAARLADDPVIWMTTVRPNGQPQASPVWFLYDGGEFLVYSKAGTARTANLGANPRVSLNLDGNGTGGDIVTIEGIATIDPSAPPSTEVAAYQDKYRVMIARNGWTPASFAADYPVAIRIRPVRTRAW
ncbi:MAG: TIGR03667 family PPOX class F420-dependent oxidoreductase [Actinobacteria bacterium]|nr:TIGR03667 family PPOX class F420-dependent oxidoreductase [Actinomycetota bacterium]